MRRNIFTIFLIIIVTKCSRGMENLKQLPLQIVMDYLDQKDVLALYLSNKKMKQKISSDYFAKYGSTQTYIGNYRRLIYKYDFLKQERMIQYMFQCSFDSINFSFCFSKSKHFILFILGHRIVFPKNHQLSLPGWKGFFSNNSHLKVQNIYNENLFYYFPAPLFQQDNSMMKILYWNDIFEFLQKINVTFHENEKTFTHYDTFQEIYYIIFSKLLNVLEVKRKSKAAKFLLERYK